MKKAWTIWMMNMSDKDTENSIEDYKHGRFKSGTIEDLLKDLNGGKDEI